MTTQKQLSHLSFAAIALVFAALPALAQTGSVDNQTAMASTSTSVASEQVAALRRDRSSVPAKEATIVVAPARTEKQSSFSATQFVRSVTEPAAVSDSTVFAFSDSQKAGQTFNESSSKSINFVPSRGPKLPWQ